MHAVQLCSVFLNLLHAWSNGEVGCCELSNTSAPAAVHWFSLPQGHAHVGTVGDLALILGEYPIIITH